MPTTDTVSRDYTAEQTQAYERYISAVADHNIVCARFGATTREKMDAAFAIDAAFREFSIVAGMEYGRGTRSPSDIERIKVLKDELDKLTEASRSAYSMIYAADAMGIIEQRPEDADDWEHDVCCCLISDAQVVLKAALERAQAVQ